MKQTPISIAAFTPIGGIAITVEELTKKQRKAIGKRLLADFVSRCLAYGEIRVTIKCDGEYFTYQVFTWGIKLYRGKEHIGGFSDIFALADVLDRIHTSTELLRIVKLLKQKYLDKHSQERGEKESNLGFATFVEQQLYRVLG